MAGVKGRSGGRNRKSTRLHLLQGTFQPSRHVVPDVEAPAGVPAVPAGLTAAALVEWTRLVEHLQAMGTLSRVDDLVLEQYARLAGDASRLQADADALDSTWFAKVSVDGAGVEHTEPKLHPVFAQLRQYRLALRVLLVELGLTPVARNRVKPAAPAAATVDRKKAKFLDALAK
jgi:P27 family predicted phage terminase small subunit